MGNDLRNRVAQNTNRGDQKPGTEVAERKPATLAEQVEQWQTEFGLAMGASGAEAQLLVRDALQLMRTTKHLSECTPSSVLGGLMTFAQLRLRPGVLGHGWLIPFKTRKNIGGKWVDVYVAQIVIGYKGYVELVHRSGAIETLGGRAVFEKDQFDVEYGVNEMLVHKPHRGRGKGTVTDYYAVIRYKGGGYTFATLTRDEAIEWRDKYAMSVRRDRNGNPVLDAEGAVQGSGPWFEMDNGPEGMSGFDQMAIKTAFLQAQKWAPKGTDVNLSRAIAVDGAVRINADPHNPDEMLHAEHPVIDMEDEDDQPPPPITDVGRPAGPLRNIPADHPSARPGPVVDGEVTAPTMQTVFAAVIGEGTDEPANPGQQRGMTRLLEKAAVKDPADQLAILGRIAGHPTTPKALDAITGREAAQVLEHLNRWQDAGTLAGQLAAVLAATRPAETAPTGPLPKPGTTEFHEQGHPVESAGKVTTVAQLMNGDCGICEQDGGEK